MFGKILIANRGEIACRVMRTAKRMGIRTVAVHSEADGDALFVRSADEAVEIGPPAARESYLVIDRIVAACRKTGAEAVHPGYGFLSENAAFAEALSAAGIVFIGPGAEAIRLMGDKVTSKTLARRAKVSTIPGDDRVMADAEDALRTAREIGYPVMLKASAGGGGKGMRIAANDEQCREGYERAAREAASAFGDDRVFVEKYITEPRHVEIQVLADAHGNIIHLGERECSVQRRHQKVVEESPSPALDPDTRAAMGEQAVALARAVGYCSAGTVEFIVDRGRRFYFLEMNTRLQVEHPVTELVTGLDLVEWMIRIAAGERLAWTQQAITPKGWAIEARIYAEDPARSFLPSTGRLVRFVPPRQDENVRLDSGVVEGSEISVFYDPLMAKLVTYGSSRSAAMARMRLALDELYVRGVSHNVPFLAALMRNAQFVSGVLSTDLIAEQFPDGHHPLRCAAPNRAQLIAVAAAMHRFEQDRGAQISGQMPGREVKVSGEWVVMLQGERHPVTVVPVEGGFDVTIAPNCTESQYVRVRTDWRPGQPLYRARIDGEPITVQVDRDGLCYQLTHAGSEVEVVVLLPRAAELAAFMRPGKAPERSKHLLSPMPGRLVAIKVQPGQDVKAGETLAVVEAMKMENSLVAEHDATVVAIRAKVGDSLALDQPIVELS